MSSVNNKPVKYTAILETTEKARLVKLHDDTQVWLSKTGSAFNPVNMTVSHPYMDQAIQGFANDGKTLDISLFTDPIEGPNSLGYDVELTFDDAGDPEMSRSDLRIFIAHSINTDDGVPHWLVTRSISNRLGDVSAAKWTLRNSEGDPILVNDPDATDTLPEESDVPSDFATA